MARVYALIDGNSFYCSCERAFDARLAKRPVLVLSNNDGCAIARTSEVKALGIKMGDPYFKIRDLCRRERVAVFSSNYTLYGDMSRRLNHIYQAWAPEIEVYSIDESFLDIAGIADGDRTTYARDLRSTVRRWTGIPTCVGIGPTKTLAKLANHTAKKNADLGGVCDFTDQAMRNRYLAATAIENVWGIGRASTAKLAALDIVTVGALLDANPKRIRMAMTVVGERIVHELRGISCLPLDAVPAQRKGLAVTRSFSTAVTSEVKMLEALAAYATRAAEKLRHHAVAAVHGHVFMHSNKHNGDRPIYSSKPLALLEATADTYVLIDAAVHAGRRAWRQGYRYAKAGIVLTELVSADRIQRSFFQTLDRDERARLMQALDDVNNRFGRGSLFPAAAGIRREWSTKFEMRSPRYTTRWSELPVANA